MFCVWKYYLFSVVNELELFFFVKFWRDIIFNYVVYFIGMLFLDVIRVVMLMLVKVIGLGNVIGSLIFGKEVDIIVFKIYDE